MKPFTLAALAALAPLALRPGVTAAQDGTAPAAGVRPSFVIILADDLGYGDLGCFGHPTLRTPHLDALAASGMRFLDFHSNGAVCSPTRAALLTGRYQQRSGVEGVITAKGHRHTGMPLAERTFAEVLSAAGYATAIFGKWHLGYPARFNPVHQGFDEFTGFVSGNVDYHSHVDQTGRLDWWKQDRIDDEPGYSTDLITGHGLEFIERCRGRPFCLYLAYGAPHYPYQGRGDAVERTPGRVTWPKHADLARRYTEMVAALDDGVGRVVAALRSTGIERRTLVLFLSDNGPAGRAAPIASAGPLRGRKGSLWEGGHRVPAIAAWPGRIRAGSTCAETCIGMDILPTLAALAGVAPPVGRPVDGTDLSPLLLGTGSIPRRTLFWRTRRARAVRKGRWKLVIGRGRRRAGAAPAETAHLFDLARDIGETRDLAPTHPATVHGLRDELARWEATVALGVRRISR